MKQKLKHCWRERGGQSGVRRHKVGLRMGNLGIKQKHSLKSGELVTLKIFATIFFFFFGWVEMIIIKVGTFKVNFFWHFQIRQCLTFLIIFSEAVFAKKNLRDTLSGANCSSVAHLGRIYFPEPWHRAASCACGAPTSDFESQFTPQPFPFNEPQKRVSRSSSPTSDWNDWPICLSGKICWRIGTVAGRWETVFSGCCTWQSQMWL